MPLQDLIMSRLNCYTQDYHESLIDWIHQYAVDLPPIGNWLALQGLPLDDYCSHLLAGRAADGLEVWIASRAMSQPYNIVFEQTVWSTTSEGIDLAYPCLLLTSNREGMWCMSEDQCDQMMGAVAPHPADTHLEVEPELPDVVSSHV